MGNPISNDMRARMVRGIEAGQSRQAVAARFEVAPSTAVRLWTRYEATGSVAPARIGRPEGSGKLGPHRDFVIGQARRRPDITMAELAALLAAERGVIVDPSNISKLLRRAGFTYKKNAAGFGARAQRRAGRAA